MHGTGWTQKRAYKTPDALCPLCAWLAPRALMIFSLIWGCVTQRDAFFLESGFGVVLLLYAFVSCWRVKDTFQTNGAFALVSSCLCRVYLKVLCGKTFKKLLSFVL